MYAMSQWHYLEQHPAATVEVDLEKIAEEVWNEINSLCELNPVDIRVSYGYEKFSAPEYHYVLATASRTMFLIDNELQSGALNKYGLTGEILIDVNPYVPNGWNVDTGSCDIGNHYDLRTVLRHEILHGIGISSSITPDNIGYSFGEFCYPYAFDTLLKTETGSQVVSGCHLLTELHSDMYAGGVQLYNPERFRIGSSLSHINRPGILFYGLPSRQCLPFDDASLTMLNALGGKCVMSHPVGITSAAGETSFWGIYIALLFCIKWALRI
jgi:hypothetical protein